MSRLELDISPTFLPVEVTAINQLVDKHEQYEAEGRDLEARGMARAIGIVVRCLMGDFEDTQPTSWSPAMNWTDILKTIAPTVASAALGPLGGIAVAAIGNALGIDAPTQDKISKALTAGQMTPEALEKIKTLELDYQNQERERGFKYAELEFKDRDSARNMAASTHALTPSVLTWIIVGLTLAAEGMLLFNQVPPGADPIIIGRVLGTMDSALVMVLSFWFGSNSGSGRTKELLAQATLK